MAELGLLEAFLGLPHQQIRRGCGLVDGDRGIPGRLRAAADPVEFIALAAAVGLPGFPRRAGGHYPGFHLLMSTEATGLIQEGGRIAG